MARRWVAIEYGEPQDVLREVDVDVAEPGPGEVTIDVRAVGMNPADYKGFAAGERSDLPRPIGSEIAGVLSALGPDTEIASGGGAPGDDVLAFRITGGYATAITVPARDVFAKPPSLGFPEAANLLLAGATAAEMLAVTKVAAGETVLLHGASGAVGVSVLQQARRIGARVVGTASPPRFGEVERFGGVPVAYGDGLDDRVRAAAPDGVDVALDAVGTDEAVDVSLALVPDRTRILTIAAAGRARQDGFLAIGGVQSDSAAFRDQARAGLIALAGAGELVVPIARTFPFAEAPAALELLRSQHPGGKLALIR